MFKNHIKIAFRNLVRDKAFSLINIAGLAVGITCFMTLALFVLDEMGFDTFNDKADRIYRLYISSDINGNAANSSKTACPTGETLKREFPEVQNYTRLGYFGQHELRYSEKIFRESDIYTADSTYFEIFSLPFIYGNPHTALVQPNSIVVSERAAHKYFGNENPVGRQFIVDDTTAYYITGVMKNFPRKSHFSCNFLLSMSTYPTTQNQNWLNTEYTTYILFKEKINPRDFEHKLQQIVLDKVGRQAELILGISLKDFFVKGNRYGLFLQPLRSIYLYSQSQYGLELNTEWGDVRTSNIYYSYIFIAIGSFILLIAVFNFTNLTTARSEGRAKEVGIRKTLGSDRVKLFWQFMSESTMTCFFSVIVAYGLTQLVLPLFNNFVGRELSLNLFDNFYTIPLFIVFTLIVGILSGSYPAFYLSSFQPSHVLKPALGKRKSTLRSLLVIVQFAISITLIIGTIIIKSQLGYILNKDLGFNKEQLVVINNASALGVRVESFKEKLSGNPNVVSSTNSTLMFRSGIPGGVFQIENSSQLEFKTCQYLDVDYDFAKTYQVQMAQGRYFSNEFSTDSSAVVLNESAAKILNEGNLIGKILYNIHTGNRGKKPLRIVGIVKDFNYESLHQSIRPLVFRISPVQQASSILTIRVRTNDYSSTINSIKELWHNFTGGKYFSCSVLNENLARQYSNEMRIEAITTVFSSLAIFIACLGLFGLAAFVTEKRMKEIGIRKVLGASMVEIIMLLSKEFTKWVILANGIAWPIAWYVMQKWLQDFAYRIEIRWWMFALAGGIALVIALATVSFQAIKAAVANPVKVLRYE